MKFVNTFKRIFSIDYRSLAAFRIVFGVFCFLNLLYLVKDFYPLFTEPFFFPPIYDFAFFNLWTILIPGIGSSWISAIAMLGAGISIICFVLGYKTRLAAILCWLFFQILRAKNVNTVGGGESLISVLFVWSIFLPLSAKFSIDALKNKEGSQLAAQYFSMATVGVLLQIACVLFFTSMEKIVSDAWVKDGTALTYALFTRSTHLGTYIFNLNHQILKVLTRLVVLIEFIAPLMLFSPYFNKAMKAIALFFLFGLMLSIALFIDVGFFPHLMMSSLILFLPSRFWSVILAKSKTKRSPSLRDPCVCSKINSNIVNITCIFLIGLMIYSNIYTFKDNENFKKSVVKSLTIQLGFYQNWKMFRLPMPIFSWVVAAGYTQEGQTYDFGEKKLSEINWDRPIRNQLYKSFRWKKFLEKTGYPNKKKEHKALAHYLCSISLENDIKISRIELYAVSQMIDYKKKIIKRGKYMIYNQSCQ